jgi:CobQ-like glutamine amidotransferase family enzyme
LRGRLLELENATEAGSVILGVCGGYQLLGHAYVSADGTEIEGLGLLDVTTGGGSGRIIGDVVANARLDGRAFELVGFENHGGRTHLGPRAKPLAKVVSGGGNNGSDGTEGAVQGGIVGTYLHGPALPANPSFADALLQRALEHRTGGGQLVPLDDDLEWAAHRHKAQRRR